MIVFLFGLIKLVRARPCPRTRPSKLGSVGRPSGAASPSQPPVAAPPARRLAVRSRARLPPAPAAAPPASAACRPASARRSRPHAAALRPRPFSASAASRPTARRPNNRRSQVNSTVPPTLAFGDCRAAPSSASLPSLPRARRRAPVDGSPRGGYRRLRLVETKPAVRPRTAAVDRSAGDAARAAAGAEKFRTRGRAG